MRLSIRVRRTLSAIAIAALVTSGTVATATAATAAPPPPAKMAALGDSITLALMSCSGLSKCQANSWATGTTASVNSHAARLKASVAPTLVTYNYAVSGAKSGALNAQAQSAAAQAVNYVTIEIGANDACTSTVSGMTATTTFRSNVQAALTTLAVSPGQPEIFVASIPSLLRMYELNKSSSSARLTWGLLRICQSMLANPSSTKAADVQRRAAVQQRVNEYNQVLAEVCAATAKCRYDGGVVADYAFTKADISTRDYFHPSLAGQATMANITWARTQWVS